MTTILCAGGGTTGHIAPMLAIAGAIQKRHPEVRILMLGTPEGLETELVPAAGYELRTIPKVPAPRSLSSSAVRFPLRFVSVIGAVRKILREEHVSLVLGVGGYVCPPAYTAAASLRIPIVVHEANMRPGLANRYGATLTTAENCGFAFANTPLKGHHVGMPTRSAIERVDRQDAQAKAAAATSLGLDPQKRSVVITGGSLGAEQINTAMVESMAQVMRTGVQVLHITGAGKGEQVRAAAAAYPDYHVVDYVQKMERVYQACDLLIARAGAATVAETILTRTPTVFVPLAIGNGEQKLNAAASVSAGAALLIENAEFSASAVCNQIIPLLGDTERLTEIM